MQSDHGGPGRDLEGSMGRDGSGMDADAARERLEDLLATLPYDRALPDPVELLQRAGVPVELLDRDERLVKVLHEAVLARPLRNRGEIHRTRTEVELLTLEVELLTDRLDDPGSDAVMVREAAARLAEIRRRLGDLRDIL